MFTSRRSNIGLNKGNTDRFISLLKGKRVLDVGCGPGRDAKYFSGKGFEVTSIDFCDRFLEIARKNAPSAKILKMDMRNLDLEGTFDGIWCSSSFHNVPKTDAVRTLAGFCRELKSQGVMYICVKRGDSEIMHDKDGFGRTYCALYSEQEIRDLLEEAGFEILDCTLGKEPWIDIFAQVSKL